MIFIFGLNFLHILATSSIVALSFETLNISFLISFFSSMNLKHLAVSINGTKLFNCLPPPKSLIVPSCEAIFENKFVIIFNLIVSVEYP